MVDLARLARLDDQTDLDALALADQVVVDSGRRQERRNGRVLAVDTAVGEDEIGESRIHRLARLPAELFRRARQAVRAVGHAEQHGHGRGLEARPVNVADPRQLGIVEDRGLELDLPAGLGRGLEEVALGTDTGRDLGHQLFADAVERRVGDLREELLEIVVEEPRAVREHGERRVGAHGADRLFPSVAMGVSKELQILWCTRTPAGGGGPSRGSAREQACGRAGPSIVIMFCAASRRKGAAASDACLISASSMIRPRPYPPGTCARAGAVPSAGCFPAGCREPAPRRP